MNMKKMANIILCLFLGGVFLGGLAGVRTALTPKGLFVTDNSHRQPDASQSPRDDIQLKGYDLEQDPYKWVKAKFVISNVSAEDVKNIRVGCEFYDRQARYVDSEQWLLAGVVPAGKTMEHHSLKRKFIHTRATDFQCSIATYDSIRGSRPDKHRTEEKPGIEIQGNAAEKNGVHH